MSIEMRRECKYTYTPPPPPTSRKNNYFISIQQKEPMFSF